MADHNYVLSPWQIYCGLFVMFWASQWYFSSFWMTILCCLKFGLIAELVTDYMYKRGRYKKKDMAGDKNKLNCLVEMAREEAALVPSLTEMAKLEVSQRTPRPLDEEERVEDVMGHVKDKLDDLVHHREMALKETVNHERNGYDNEDDDTDEETDILSSNPTMAGGSNAFPTSL
eukprot:TRINITY_DN3284_c0_g1_i1.p1 TRINITY_DN3284_c0_g1~~TRINITY_DN3284_c0_g1_i1.p1  ORF type:complete len:188 (+),score=82.27 TRINITY_DN3284_c0_g1_i1:45-566(+)